MDSATILFSKLFISGSSTVVIQIRKRPAKKNPIIIDKKTKFNLKKECKQSAIIDHFNYGPVFGGAGEIVKPDIVVWNNSNQNNYSYTNLLNTFENSSLYLKYETQKAKKYLAGSYNFKAVEIEVFQILKS